jgi:hypothetical protein
LQNGSNEERDSRHRFHPDGTVQTWRNGKYSEGKWSLNDATGMIDFDNHVGNWELKQMTHGNG